MYNPFAKRLQRLHQQLDRVLARQRHLDQNLIPSTFETGNSGIPASRRRKLDQQLARTINLASEMVNLKQRIDWLQSRHDLFEDGKINANGSPRRIKPPAKKRVISDSQALLHRSVEQIAIYGHAQLPGGYYVSAHWAWDEIAFELRGLIKVINPDGSPTRHYTNACGAAIEDKSIEVVKQLLEIK
jgi:hypothetical protein